MADNRVMEEREEPMVSPTGGHVCIRRAHFLIPSVTSIDGPAAAPSLDSLSSSATRLAKYKDLPFKVNYRGWKYRREKWKTWVDQMQSSHHSTWKRAGILDAIMSSTCIIHRYDDLIFGFVEKWCPTTNSFVFPWGEATITLEDMMVLGGYCVLGESVLIPRGNEEMEKKVKKLLDARSKIIRTKSKKASQGKWITQFMGSGSEIEHEAFLAYWLSRFVFPLSRDAVGRSVLSIAVHLARGTKIALAPAVLACIYKSLTLLKAAVIAARKSGTEDGQNGVFRVTVSAPVALVQVWIWERFPSLRPQPKSIGQNEPRLARWHNLKLDRSLTIDSAGKDFQWRPYTTTESNMIYMDNERWAMVDSDLDEDLKGFVRCLRTSELVSLEADCIEHYLPHRVAMQFGMDQDLPGHVARVNVNPEIGWRDYTRPIRDAKLYVPPRLSEPCVTTRYLKWWKKLNLGWSGVTEPDDADGKSTCEDSKVEVKKELFGRKSQDFLPPPPGFSPKLKTAEEAGASGILDQFQDRRSTNFVPQQDSTAKAGFGEKGSSKSSKRKFVESSADYNDSVPPGFSPKYGRVKAFHSDAVIEKTGQSCSVTCGNNQSQDHAHQGKNHLSLTPNNENNIQEAMLLVEPIESEVKCTLRKDASEAWMDRLDKKIGVGPSQVQSNTSPEIGIGERIRNIEKLCAWLKAGKLVCL